jgi:hypothetical protein
VEDTATTPTGKWMRESRVIEGVETDARSFALGTR